MRQGVLIYDHDTDRMDIRFDLDDYYGGLHCGTSMEVFVNNKWVPTRIEINDQWYLVGIKTGNLRHRKRTPCIGNCRGKVLQKYGNTQV